MAIFNICYLPRVLGALLSIENILEPATPYKQQKLDIAYSEKLNTEAFPCIEYLYDPSGNAAHRTHLR